MTLLPPQVRDHLMNNQKNKETNMNMIHNNHHSMESHQHMVGKDMDMGEDSCSMNMLFSWSYKNTCVVFKWWHIRSFFGLIISCLSIMTLSYLYEYFKYRLNSYEENELKRNSNAVNTRKFKLHTSIWYAVQVGFSFMLMLVFMTYNGWLMLAVVFGAFLGHYSWNVPNSIKSTLGSQSLACH
ncbi:low-affinity Cu transporter NDAI_0C03430 [Naumovozyma dairenensis CBS 421]|uniref:Copper transport protein n=1 Tax=Naumovozyma dairenensis (strain ATCC 10597 / BCRC 20456 / CBS 421 / NBRC 0211 / NRRL Y-12639) TaxID=1071378 RepID=G0W892_NAUDC|nr:hypothetical protein NDAI_0C03430 [Naumovozyma dairenensis CBS 421]CCD24003.1 hypothetical protein NDAI_0C03430 [Naumovozyma dairenensis CBS 421]